MQSTELEHPVPFPKFELRLHPEERVGLTGLDGASNVGYVSDPGSFVYGLQEYTIVTYSFYYRTNPAIGCVGRCFPDSAFWGYHPHDLEKITVLYAAGEPRHVFFFAHGRGQGMWVPWSECLTTGDGALVVYVANNSHASYPRPGRYTRAAGLLNDECLDGGKILRPLFRRAEDKKLSPGGGVRLTRAAVRPPAVSITPFERFFLCFFL